MSTIPFMFAYRLEPSVKKPFIEYAFASWLRKDANSDSMIAFLKQVRRLHPLEKSYS